jgi:ubiquinol-cytochrome c reductase iron-sulfur subunit
VNRPAGIVGLAFTLSILAGLGLAVVYILGGQAQLEGALLFVALGGVGIGLIVWATRVLPHREVTQDRETGPSAPEERRSMEAELEAGGAAIGRRRFLVRLLAGAAGALGLAALFPILSLGPSPGRSLFETPWRKGIRLVKQDGSPVLRGDLEVESILTVFPEGSLGSADGQAVLIRVDPDTLDLPADRLAGAPDGYVCYSKVCTHAGCPVGLYLASEHQLRCPCHQSTFDVLRGAAPVYGPAARPLPQLLIQFDEKEALVAQGDFTDPIGPGFWNLPPA